MTQLRLAQSLARAVAACALLLSAGAARAVVVERGSPLINVYPAEVHKGGPQTFDLAQDSRGILYFGNLHGLLSYDGAWWRMLKLPDDQAGGALAADAHGRVVVAAVNELGVLEADGKGEMQYRSLNALVPQNAREFGDALSVCSTDAGFLFLFDSRLLLWDGGRAIRVSPAPHERAKSPRRCLKTANGVFVTGPNGLQQVDLKTLQLTPGGESRRVDLAVDAGGGRLMLVVRDAGIFMLANGVATPFAPEAAAWVKGKSITGGCRLRDGRFVITTRQDGLVIVGSDGAVEQIIDTEAGLPDSVLTEPMIDREGALWLAMEGPIVRIDVASPVSVFDHRRGLKGSVGDVTRHDGRLYAASSHGLHVFDEHGVATRVDGVDGAAWRLLAVDGELLVGHSRGLSRIRGNGPIENVFNTEGEIYDLSRSPKDPNRVWLGSRVGVIGIVRDGGTWKQDVTVPYEYLTTIVEHDGVLWCGTVFDGILRIDDARGKPRIRRLGTGEMNVFRVDGRVVFVNASTSEIVSVSERGHLIPDPFLGHIKVPGFFVLVQDTNGNVWVNSTPPRVYKRAANNYPTEGEPLVSVTATDIQCLRAAPGGIVWFGSDKGLFRYEPSAASAVVAQPAPLIRRVVAGDDRLLYGGMSAPAEPALGFDLRRRMRIEFAPASYRPGVTYQYRLDPVDTEWSQWTGQPFIDYTSLDADRYVFRLRARGPATAVSREARWGFSVRPPWYRTTWAYALWILLAGAAIAFVIGLRTRALQRQAEELRARVSEQTVMLRHKNDLLEQANARLENLSLLDDLTGIANRRYFQKALSDEWNRAARREEPLSLILVDLDYFKELNDRRGHRAGDECLRDVGRFLGETIRRSGEVVARYGGEEFAVLLPAVDADEALRVAERLRQGIEKLDVRYDEEETRCVTTSCGVATMIPRRGDSMETLVDLADRALYAAKHAGRNRVNVADDLAAETWLSM